MEKECLVCNNVFNTKNPIKTYCSLKCKSRANYFNHKNKLEKNHIGEIGKCIKCNKSFKQNVEGSKLFCSKKCRDLFKYYIKKQNGWKAKSIKRTKLGKERRNARIYFRRKNDELFKLRETISNQIRKSLKNKKTISCKKIINIKKLKSHLESQFTPEMTWKNYGIYWEIDHKIPISWFKTKNQIIKKGFSINNLQPLEKKLNNSKKNYFVAKGEHLRNNSVINI